MRSLFPCNVHEICIKDFKIIKDEVLNYIYQEKKKSHGVIKSNRGGWQSPAVYTQFNNILSDIVKKEVTDYFTINKIFKEGVGIYFDNLWININPKGAFNVRHVHPQSDISGVWWINIPKDSDGRLYFVNPHEYTHYEEIQSYSEEFKKSTSSYPEFYHEPTEGVILLFPSNLHHYVEENMSNKERISVSFNIRLRPLDPSDE
tara:strand:- start:206 stop:814 length:609 start_codon:yes stop_codon:yes gene_type:complete